MAFKSAGNKEDSSVYLKAQNLKNAKEQTKKLEVESRKMEDRLKELKLAVNREKEDRRINGNSETTNGFWKSGQTGNLNNFTKEILADQNIDKNKKKTKLTVLKDEPIEQKAKITDKRKTPGTLAFLAQQGENCKSGKVKGAKCGQCEVKAANVACVECCEDYCAACFASFHLKGALKRHRSTPISANGISRMITPRTDGAVQRALQNQNTEGNHRVDNITKQIERENSIIENSLLNGVYDEKSAAESFKQAVSDWRKTDVIENGKAKNVNVTTMECSTSAGDENVIPKQQKIEIKFSQNSNSNISYADKLLLKKNRRSPINFNENRSNFSPLENLDLKFTHGSDEENEERVDFNSLYQAAVDTGRVSSDFSNVSVIDIDEPIPAPPSKPVTPGANFCRKRAFESICSPRRIVQTPLIEAIDDTPVVSPTQSANLSRKSSNSVQIREENDLSLPIKDLNSETPKPIPSKSKISNRPKSVNERSKTPRTPRRPPSRIELTSRCKTIFGDGVITKQPTDGVKYLSSMSSHIVDNPSFTYTSINETKDKILSTPRSKSSLGSKLEKPSIIEKWRTSNHIYTLGARSWKPEKSLSETIDNDQLALHLQDENNLNILKAYENLGEEETIPVMSYVWSEQKENSFKSCELKSSFVKKTDFHGSDSLSRPESRAIVVDGQDLSNYDDNKHTDENEDIEAINQLEWEFASQNGLIDESGNISRMSVLIDEFDNDGNDENTSISPKDSWDKFQIEKQLDIKEAMYDDFEEMESELICEEEVSKLK